VTDISDHVRAIHGLRNPDVVDDPDHLAVVGIFGPDVPPPPIDGVCPPMRERLLPVSHRVQRNEGRMTCVACGEALTSPPPTTPVVKKPEATLGEQK
jgi:hypothetical protein